MLLRIYFTDKVHLLSPNQRQDTEYYTLAQELHYYVIKILSKNVSSVVQQCLTWSITTFLNWIYLFFSFLLVHDHFSIFRNFIDSI